MTNIQEKLLNLKDDKFKAFMAPLIPNIDKELIIGVRNPELKKLAKELMLGTTDVYEKEVKSFFLSLPHYYQEENILHAYLINEIKHDKYLQLEILEQFLPYINNWAVCDILTPKLVFKDKTLIHDKCIEWIEDERTYIKRFGIVTCKRLFLNPLDLNLFNKITSIKTEEYYVQMGIAWFIAECAIENPDIVMNLLENRVLYNTIQNKSIQKIVDSTRIDKDFKDKMKKFRLKF